MNSEMSVVPPGGFRFVQRLPNGGMKMFVGLGVDDLISQVRTFRLNANLPVEGLEMEIKQGISGPAHAVKLEDQRTLRERVTGWKSNRAYQTLGFVEPEVAAQRAQVCVDCPFNQVKYADSCLECFVHVERDLYAMRQGRSTDQDPWLGACQIAGHENKTAVHLEQKHLLHRRQYEEELREKVPQCWLLQLDKGQTKEGE